MNDDYFHHMHIPPEAGHALMRAFTRMEYALKASGDFADGNAEFLSPAWDRFANTIDGAFQAIDDKALRDAAAFLLSEPARKQIMGSFAPLALDQNQTRTQRTLHAVRTVRNNILHGAKIQPEGENEKGRNERLVAASLLVLQTAADLNDKVRAKFSAAAS